MDIIAKKVKDALQKSTFFLSFIFCFVCFVGVFSVVSVKAQTESVIPLGGTIMGTTVVLKANARDSGASPSTPKELYVEFELKKVGEAYNETTGMYQSTPVTYTGGTPVVHSVSVSGLERGASYKWRARVVNAANGLKGDWSEFGGNASDAADFMISSVVSLELTTNKTSLLTGESADLIVTARNGSGIQDSTYRGTVTFYTNSPSADIPANYTFTSGDNGRKVFSGGAKFYTAGNFSVTTVDTVVPVLTDSVNFSVSAPQIPLVYLTSDKYSVDSGEPFVLSWVTEYVSNVQLSNVGSVVADGSIEQIINLPNGVSSQTYTYTLQGTTAGNSTLTTSVDILVTQIIIPPTPTPPPTTTIPPTTVPVTTTVPPTTQAPTNSPTDTPTNTPSESPTNTPTVSVSPSVTDVITPSVSGSVTPTVSVSPSISPTTSPETTGQFEPTPTTTPTITPTITQTSGGLDCPSIESFTVSAQYAKIGDLITFSWRTQNSDIAFLDIAGFSVGPNGSLTIEWNGQSPVTLKAIKGTCQRIATVNIGVLGAVNQTLLGASVVTVAVVEIALASSTSANVGQLLFVFIDRLRKRLPWGIVYDATTKKYVSRAIVRQYEVATGKLVSTVVTDAMGVFKLTPKKGRYLLKVIHPDYNFPSTVITANTDGSFTNIYHGEDFLVVQDDQPLTLNIPVDRKIQFDKRRAQIRSIINLVERFINRASFILLVAGVLISVYAAVTNPIPFNIAVVLFYILFFVIKIYLLLLPQFGRIRQVNGRIVAGVEVGLYETEFDTLLTKTYSDKNGQYIFYVPNNNYYLKITDPRYTLSGNDKVLIKKESRKSAIMIIKKNLRVIKK